MRFGEDQLATSKDHIRCTKFAIRRQSQTGISLWLFFVIFESSWQRCFACLNGVQA
jgi:hypothetical protein